MYLYLEQAEEAARQVVAAAAAMGVATAVAEVGVVDVDVATRSRYVHTSEGRWTKKIRTRLGVRSHTSHPGGNIKLYI